MWLVVRLSVLCGVLAAIAVESVLYVYVAKILGVIVGVWGYVAIARVLRRMIAGAARLTITWLALMPVFLVGPWALEAHILADDGIRVEATVVSDWYLNRAVGDEASGTARTERTRQCVIRLPDGRVHPKRISDCDTPVGESMTLTVDHDLRVTPSRDSVTELSGAPGGWFALAGLFAAVFLLGEFVALVSPPRPEQHEGP